MNQSFLYGAQNKAFTQYFQNRGIVDFTYHDHRYLVSIDRVMCFPQAYAAAVTILGELVDTPKALILDIGGITADYLMLKRGRADLSTCDSLENGVILLYNRVRSKVNADLDYLLEESDVDSILRGEKKGYDPLMVELVEQQAQQFIYDLFGNLRERMIDLRTGKVIFVGGGAALLRSQIEASGRVGEALFVDSIQANASGYEYLYQRMAVGR